MSDSAPGYQLNLDCESIHDLERFAHLHHYGANHRELFPCGKGIGTTATLASYAAHRALAMRHRTAGDIQRARRHEDTCNTLYAILPDEVKW